MGINRRDFISAAAAASALVLTGCQTPITSKQDTIAMANSSTAVPNYQGPRTRRVLHVVTNVSHYDDVSHPTGLWLSELTHAYDAFAAQGYSQSVVSPLGGVVPIEPRSLKWPYFDKSAREGKENPVIQSLLANSLRPQDVNAQDFDIIYFAGGHGVMWDFPNSAGLQTITRDIFERGGIVAAVCHGYCGLLNTKLSNGSLLVEGRRLTGYSWIEEVLAGVAKEVPYNVEEEMRKRGALYEKAFIPFTSKVVIDGRLVTGQNPQSAKAVADAVVGLL
ncbi:type 1 glutamine amidotransferase domain-containing protein [Pseudoduganella sp. UC29_106]|uniref:type 1 glutamine amidotransferase domain-containing protein n=1 Tax=Pseudoduganella sp. UC29_106 TaxID=3374553 RepID=UPI00375678CD